jgi:hypothetical protein
MQHNNRPARYSSQIPYSVLDRAELGEGLAPIGKGVSHLPEKTGEYRTTEGMLSLEEYNRRASANRPTQMEPGLRHLCDTSIKYAADDNEAVQRLYADERKHSAALADAPLRLSRDEVEGRRR